MVDVKVGDRVRVNLTALYDGEALETSDGEGVVVFLHGDVPYPFEVRLDKGVGTELFAPEEILNVVFRGEE